MKKLSVVISAYNEEHRIQRCLESVKFADEIILVDNTSSDKTAERAKQCGATVFVRPNNPMLNANKNFGFSKVSGEWILSLDADETVSPELRREIETLLSQDTLAETGFEIPRKNLIFGKWITHTGWYPDYQLRLFKKGKGAFPARHVHEKLVVEGKIGKCSGWIEHDNYASISQFIEKLNRYTDNEAAVRISDGASFTTTDLINRPIDEFYNRYIREKGYRDGLHGFILSVLMAFYYFVVYLKLWEKGAFAVESEPPTFLDQLRAKLKFDHRYWLLTKKHDESTNAAYKFFIRIVRKLHKQP